MRGGGVVQKSCPFSGRDFWPAFSVPERELQPDWRAVASSKKRDRAEMKSYIYVYRSVRNLQVREMFGNEIVVESGALFCQPTSSHYSCALEGPPRQPTTTSVRLWSDARSSITFPLTCALLTCSSAHTNPPRNRHRVRIYVNHGGLTDN